MTAMTDSSDGPTIETNTITSSSVGMLMTVSVMRMITWSTTPPERPAIRPRIVPMTT